MEEQMKRVFIIDHFFLHYFCKIFNQASFIRLIIEFLMQYNQINRNSLMSCVASDRPAFQYSQANESWRNVNNQPHHLNPSKSKVNVRQSLNKTVDHYSNTTPTPNITSIRNSCLFSNPSSTHAPSKQPFQEDKFFKASKENQDAIIGMLAKDTSNRFIPLGHSTPINFGEQRKKSQSAHYRTGSSNQFLFKLDNDFTYDTIKIDKTDKFQKTQGTEQLKDMINALTKRVVVNEDEISKLKQKGEKEKKLSTLQSEISQYKGKLFDLAKFNSKNFMEIQAKLQHNQQALADIREKVSSFTSYQEFSKKFHILDSKINELFEGFKLREQNFEKQITKKVNQLQNKSNYPQNDDLMKLKNIIQELKKQVVGWDAKMKNAQITLTQKIIGIKQEQMKRSNKKCLNPLTIQNKETLTIKENNLFADRSNRYLNSSLQRSSVPITKKQFVDTPRKDSFNDPKNDLLVKQKTYYIDSCGYLLDQNRYYLLNSKNQQIYLPQHLISLLKDNNILSNTLKI